MNISKVGIYNTKTNSIAFKNDQNSKKAEYENPVSRNTEKNLAILSSSAGAALVGALAYGASYFVTKTRNARLLIGAAAAGITLAITLPPALYNRKVSAFVKQKEMDVFSRDRNLKTNLTEEVDKEVLNPDVSLDKKLDDNLKLQMANRGAAIGIANVTSQA